MKTTLTALVLFLIITSIHAQDQQLIYPKAYQAAMDNNTRTVNGMPGESYWLNHADYNMDVDVDPETGLISGSASITWFNNSPDTLRRIVLRLYQNIYKKGNSRQFNIGDADLTDGVEISKLKIDDVEYDVNSRKVYMSATNMYLSPDEPIMPGSSAKIEIDWNFTMPQIRWIRFGQYSKQHLFVGYWYPQVAVYDDIDGWDKVEYAGMVEYYNDPNSFKVNITAPANFVIWATGELQNAEEVFSKQVFKKYESAKTSDKVVRIITQDDYNSGKVTQKADKHTWTFYAENVPDFAFAASSGSNWDATSLIVDPETQRRVLVSSVYPDSAVHYDKVAEITRNAVEYMSYELPGFPFPYPQATVFANGRKNGGMEFPMIANDGAPDDYADLVGLTYHEVFHNYFPFFMGTNERKYAFMDEGWARYFPKGFLEKYEPEDEYFQRTISQYENFAGSENELPPMIPTYIFNDYQTQRMAAYTRPAVAYFLLHGMLGDDLFKVALKEYMQRWSGKHPMPYDFFNSFNDVAGEDLSWFWNPWFFDRGYPDLSIKELSDDNVILIEKMGLLPVPVELVVFFEDGTQKTISRNARVWSDNKTVLAIPVLSNSGITKIELGNDLIPDSNRKNNLWSKKVSD